MKIKSAALALVLLTFGACDNEIDINAPYKETPVVYGFLNVSEPIQYIRIQKTYQNSVKETTQQGAKKGDSLYFKALNVVITASDGNIYTLRDTLMPKSDGLFSTDKHKLYYLPMSVDPNLSYVLSIKSPETGKVYKSSQTAIVGSASFAGMNNAITLGDGLPDYGTVALGVNHGNNAFTFDAIIRFRYSEAPDSDPNDSTVKFVDYEMIRTGKRGNASTYRKTVTGEIFLSAIKRLIPVKPGWSRRFLSIEYIVGESSSALAELAELSVPSTTITQKNPEYTNLDNGALGIFSSISTGRLQVAPRITGTVNSPKAIARFMNTEPGRGFLVP